MNSIKDIRVIQKLRKCKGFVEEHGKFIHKEWTEMVSWKLQIKYDGFISDWEDIEVVEEWIDD